MTRLGNGCPLATGAMPTENGNGISWYGRQRPPSTANGAGLRYEWSAPDHGQSKRDMSCVIETPAEFVTVSERPEPYSTVSAWRRFVGSSPSLIGASLSLTGSRFAGCFSPVRLRGHPLEVEQLGLLDRVDRGLLELVGEGLIKK